MRVRCYVNAGGSAYYSGRLDEAERYVAADLRAAADGEFFAGQWRPRLTAAAVQASRGKWERAVAGLRDPWDSPGEPGLVAAPARSVWPFSSPGVATRKQVRCRLLRLPWRQRTASS